MDKNSLIGFGLIAIILGTWLYFSGPSKEQIAKSKRIKDSLEIVQKKQIAIEAAKIEATQKVLDTIKAVIPVSDSLIQSEFNKFNQIVLEKFASRQAYQVIKGHYIPIVMNDVTDESVLDLEKRKFYIQKYTFTLLGFLIDEDEFEITPAITRVFQIFETETKTGLEEISINSLNLVKGVLNLKE